MIDGDVPGCLSADTLVELLEARADPATRARALEHAARCAACRVLLSDLARDVTPGPDDATATTIAVTPGRDPARARCDARLDAGTRLGRYVVGDILGAGGMGVVYAARDPELDRAIAIKILRADLGAPELEARLRREAQAMAQLSHPNVVAVHDVGVVDDRVFVAMELIDGTTLSAWCAAGARSTAAIVAALHAAGRGLAAAHQAGLVHRDFKPENVLVGRDDRPRVVDFGLSRTDAGGASGAGAAPSRPGLTVHGAVMGTPQYMSPEQRRGEPADARSDQYSFCLSAETLLAGRRIPARVRRALRRGLAARAADRFASMDELLAALAPPRRRRSVIAAGLTLTAATAIVAATWARADAPAACDGRASLRGVWDPARKARLRAAFERTGAPYAGAAAREVERAFDAHAAGWATLRTALCEATRRGDEPAPILALRATCLDGRLHELAALGDRLLEADRDAVLRAGGAAGALSDLATCADLEALTAPVRPPDDPAVRARVAAVRDRVIDARVLLDAGRFREGLPIARTAVAAARAIGYHPLEAEALQVEGDLHDELGDQAAAIASLEAAVWAAEAGRHDVAAARTLAELIFMIGVEQARPADAFALRPRVTAVLERLGHPAKLEGVLLEAIGKVEVDDGRLDDAERDLTRALALTESAWGKDHLRTVEILRALGKAALLRGDPARAGALFDRVLAIDRRLLGDDHPDVASALDAVASARYASGDYAGAAELYQRALAIDERALGPDHAEVGNLLHNLGLVRTWQGDDAAAIPLFERALAITERAMGPDHPDTATIATSLADGLERAGRHDDAARLVARALAIYRPRGDHAEHAAALQSLAMIELARGHLDAARRAADDADAMYGRVDATPEQRADVRRTLGEIALAAGHADRAIAPLEAALAGDDGTEPATRAWVQGLLGRALVDSGRDARRGRDLARAARAYMEHDDRTEEQRRALVAWMNARRIR